MEMFEDKTQLEDLCDMIISGELSRQVWLSNHMHGLTGHSTPHVFHFYCSPTE
jgi:hypothetical protein